VKVSVVVPAFNEERLLPESLRCTREAMRVFERRGWASELIVCDNNSTDRTAELARAAGAKVVFEPVNQISRARNAGAAQAAGDWLVFVDADSFPSPELFEDAAQLIAAGRCLAGGSTVAFADRHPSLTFAAAAWNAISRAGKWAAGSFLFCEAAAFREAGGFDETLYAGEELALFHRLKRMARRERRSITILHRHPLRTSGRKLHLYGWRQYLKFIAKTLLTGGRSLRRREDCVAWYDGRR
jgi:glycosyltransferase involved in cell wall biosynthesis